MNKMDVCITIGLLKKLFIALKIQKKRKKKKKATLKGVELN